MNDKTIIADAGPLIAFAKIRRIHLLNAILGDIIIPQAVARECLADIAKPGAKTINEAILANSIEVYKEDIEPIRELAEFLGAGESTAISLAIKLKLNLLIDEKYGRHIATQNKIKIIGTAGVLLLAKEKKLIEAVASLIKELKEAGYYLSPELTELVITKANEQTTAFLNF